MANILLVDDNEDLRALLTEVLADAGHAVTEAPNGRVAITRLRSAVFDVVITDVVMPEADGAEVLATMRKLAVRPRWW